MKKTTIAFHMIRMFLFANILISCQDDITNRNEFTPVIVIEGRIETDDYPRVFLTRNIPYYVGIDSAEFTYLVIKQAKVTVSDGETSEILMLTYDSDYFPPYYYRGLTMLGKANKTYSLKVEYDSLIFTATTTIPPPVKPDSVWFSPKKNETERGEILVSLHDSLHEKNFYKMYTKIEGIQKDYFPTLISIFDDQLFNGQVFTFHLDKGPETYLDLSHEVFTFSKNDIIWVKICTIDQQNFDFWNSYQNEITNGANPFASSFHEIKSNIEGKGGIGVWGGYGSIVYKILPK